jgi:hypothetical protein
MIRNSLCSSSRMTNLTKQLKRKEALKRKINLIPSYYSMNSMYSIVGEVDFCIFLDFLFPTTEFGLAKEF